MAVTGYEVDQVRITKDGEDIPVPITWAYNHHYGANLVNSRKFQLVRKEKTADAAKLELAHGASHHLVGEFKEGMAPVDDSYGDEIPQMHFFSEANGGEMRLGTAENNSDVLKRFQETALRLTAEDERLLADLKNLERDEGYLDEERNEVEASISENTVDAEKLRNEAG